MKALVVDVFRRSFNEGLSRNKTLSLLQTILTVLAFMLVLRVIVVRFGVDAAGLWSLTVGLVGMMKMLDLGGTNSLPRFVAISVSNELKSAKYIDSITLFVLAVSVGLSVVGFYVLPAYLLSLSEGFDAQIVTNLLFVVLLTLPVSMVGLAQLNALDGLGRADLRVLCNVLGLLVLMILIWLTPERFGLIGVAVVYLLHHTFVLMTGRAAVVALNSALRVLPTHFSKRLVLDCIPYSAKVSLATMPLAVLDSGTRIYIASATGLSAVAYYDIAYKLVGQARSLVQSFTNPLLPALASAMTSEETHQAKELLLQSHAPVLYVNSVCYFAIIASAPLMSYVFFQRVDYEFLVIVVVLAVGWFASNNTLPINIYAKASALLAYSMLGQVLALLIAVSMLVCFSVKEITSIALVVSSSIALGFFLAYRLEARALRVERPRFVDRLFIVTLVIYSILIFLKL